MVLKIKRAALSLRPRTAEHFECMSLQMQDNREEFKKTWNPRFTLRSHFDAIRALTFHPGQAVLLTASEDGTLKLWNLNKAMHSKKWVALTNRQSESTSVKWELFFKGQCLPSLIGMQPWTWNPSTHLEHTGGPEDQNPLGFRLKPFYFLC